MEKLSKTSDYSRFKFMSGQRPVDMGKPEFRALRRSMREYGFIPSKPIQARPNGDGRLEIVDGQHRFTAAKELGLSVYYVIDKTDIDVAVVNHAQRKWAPEDYAHRFASDGVESYQTLLDYHHSFGIPITHAASIMAGTVHFWNINERFYSGEFKVTNGGLAAAFGMVYRDVCKIIPHAKKVAFLQALYRCWFVDYFDPDRLISSIEKRPQVITRSGNVAMYLEQIEECYNFGKHEKHPLAFDVDKVMIERQKCKTRS